MDVHAFDFDLPSHLIAQDPATERGGARLMCLRRGTGAVEHRLIASLPELLDEGDLLVVNNSRVFPARLLGRRLPGGGAVECLLVGRLAEPAGQQPPGERWEALMHPGQKLRPGTRVIFPGPQTLQGEVLEQRFFGRRVVRLWSEDGAPVEAVIDAIGHVPLPPYIKRADQTEDRERYQTMFAGARGSIAAPTAGLHFSRELVSALGRRGVSIAQITLHVGYGTFQPVRTEQVEDHRLEPERYIIDAEAAATINAALDAGRRVIAVGTTTTRTLEAVGREHGGRIVAGSGTTALFIYPGFEFRIIRGLLTNFHLPRSSLLMLVSAFAGREHVLAAYRLAIGSEYRFYSYGDAMLIV